MVATKDQERKALEQIKLIIKSFGEDSYIGKAFEGCLEDAEENIEYDFALSMADRYAIEKKRADEACKELAEVKSREKISSNSLKEVNDILSNKIEETWKLNRELEEAKETIREHEARILTQMEELARLETENMKLKAQLYDFMTK